MDEQIVGMIRDSLERLEGTCHGIREDMAAHQARDEEYWKLLDQQQGQISMIKVIGGVLGGGVAIWEGVKNLWR
jgi:hypothetical protein